MQISNWETPEYNLNNDSIKINYEIKNNYNTFITNRCFKKYK